MGVRRAGHTRGRLDHADSAWRAVPDPGRKRIERKARAPVRSTCSLDPARVRGGRVGRTTGPPGLRWQPSPAWGHAGRGRVRRCRVPTRLVVVRCADEGMATKGGNSRSTRRGGVRDHRNWDLAAKYGRYVPPSLILDVCVAVGGGNGTTAGCVAPGSDGLVAIRRASKSGTAARATTYSVVIPTRPASHVRERRERVDTRDCLPCARRGSARAGDGAPTKRVNNGVDLDRVDNFPGLRSSPY
jgi:hypothetical protein